MENVLEKINFNYVRAQNQTTTYVIWVSRHHMLIIGFVTVISFILDLKTIISKKNIQFLLLDEFYKIALYQKPPERNTYFRPLDQAI